MKTWQWMTAVLCVGASAAACTVEENTDDDDGGSGGNTGAGGASVSTGGPAGPTSTTTSTGSGMQFDEAGGFSFQMVFEIAAAGATTGALVIQYFDSPETQNEVCTDVYNFTATMSVPAELVACPDGITDTADPSCRAVCPLDLDEGGLTGTCIGNLGGLTVSGKDAAQSDCNFAPNTDPFADTSQFGLFEQYFFSQPVQSTLATGFEGAMQPQTWGEFATQVESANAGTSAALQIERLLPGDGGELLLTSGNAEARHWGITVSNDGGDTDPNAVGRHFAFFSFVFQLTGG